MHLSLRSLPRTLAIAAVALGVPALAPQGASAAVTCISNDNEHMIVKLYASGDTAIIKATANGSIIMGVACPGASKP
jgi:hypothetical protein